MCVCVNATGAGLSINQKLRALVKRGVVRAAEIDPLRQMVKKQVEPSTITIQHCIHSLEPSRQREKRANQEDVITTGSERDSAGQSRCTRRTHP